MAVILEKAWCGETLGQARGGQEPGVSKLGEAVMEAGKAVREGRGGGRYTGLMGPGFA